MTAALQEEEMAVSVTIKRGISGMCLHHLLLLHLFLYIVKLF